MSEQTHFADSTETTRYSKLQANKSPRHEVNAHVSNTHTGYMHVHVLSEDCCFTVTIYPTYYRHAKWLTELASPFRSCACRMHQSRHMPIS